MTKNSMKFGLQDSLYAFPYHYLPGLDEDNVFYLHRKLDWGLDYMTYMSFVAEFITKKSPASLCDVGCGDGRLLQMLRSSVPELTGIDLSEQATSFARAFNPDSQIVCADVSTLFPSTYECVTLIEVMEHISDGEMEEFVVKIAQLVKPNGFLFITVPASSVPINDKHYRHYTLDVLRDEITPYFDIADHWWLYRRNLGEKLMRRLIHNSFFVLNYRPLLSLVWRMHKRFNYYANATNATHLACLAIPKSVR